MRDLEDAFLGHYGQLDTNRYGESGVMLSGVLKLLWGLLTEEKQRFSDEQ